MCIYNDRTLILGKNVLNQYLDGKTRIKTTRKILQHSLWQKARLLLQLLLFQGKSGRYESKLKTATVATKSDFTAQLV
jgi:hypothetical protein